MIYLPGYQLDGIILKGLYVFESAYEDLLQLAMSIGLEGHPGQTLARQDNREQVHQLTTLTVLLDGHPHAPPPDFRVHRTGYTVHPGTATDSSSFHS